MVLQAVKVGPGGSSRVVKLRDALKMLDNGLYITSNKSRPGPRDYTGC